MMDLKSVGMMTFPTEWKVIKKCSKPPTSCGKESHMNRKITSQADDQTGLHFRTCRASSSRLPFSPHTHDTTRTCLKTGRPFILISEIVEIVLTRLLKPSIKHQSWRVFPLNCSDSSHPILLKSQVHQADEPPSVTIISLR